MTTTSHTPDPDRDRAAFFLAKADALGMSHADAYDVADQLIDMTATDFDTPPMRALAALGIGLFSSDDDYDDFRAELRAIIDPDADDDQSLWGMIPD